MNKIAILGIDTSTVACSVGILVAGKIIERFAVVQHDHTKRVLQMILEVLDEAQLSLSELSALAFTKGPGSFTGLRVASSVIQGLGFGCQKPVIGLSTLQVLAQTAFIQTGCKHIFCALDARMEQLYWGCYRADEHRIMQAITADSLGAVNQIHWPTAEENIKWQGVGTGCVAYQLDLQSVYRQLIIDSTIEYPRMAGLLQLADYFFVNQRTHEPQQAIPVYIRNKVVQ